MVCTVKQAAVYFQQLDPRTPINESYIMQLVVTGAILSVSNGADCLVSTSDVLAHARIISGYLAAELCNSMREEV